MGVSKLMDLLDDSREIIRNDVSLGNVCAFTDLFFYLKKCASVPLFKSDFFNVLYQGPHATWNTLGYLFGIFQDLENLEK